MTRRLVWNPSLCGHDQECFLDHRVAMANIVADDDSTVPCQARWCDKDCARHHDLPRVPVEQTSTGKDKKHNNKGELHCPCPEPVFLADPGHRKKTIKTHVHWLKKKAEVEQLGITDVDILRVSTNFTCVMNALPTMEQNK